MVRWYVPHLKQSEVSAYAFRLSFVLLILGRTAAESGGDFGRVLTKILERNIALSVHWGMVEEKGHTYGVTHR